MKDSNSIPPQIDPFGDRDLSPDQLISDFFEIQDIQTIRHKFKSITNMVVLSDKFSESDQDFRSSTIFMIDTVLSFCERLNQKQIVGPNCKKERERYFVPLPNSILLP